MSPETSAPNDDTPEDETFTEPTSNRKRKKGFVTGKFSAFLKKLSNCPELHQSSIEMDNYEALYNFRWELDRELSDRVVTPQQPREDLGFNLDDLFAGIQATPDYSGDKHERQTFFAPVQPTWSMKAKNIDNRGDAFDMHTASTYADIEKIYIENMLVSAGIQIKDYPCILKPLLDIAWVKEVGKGRSKSHEFRRSNAPQFDCLHHLLALEVAEVHRNLVPGKRKPTIRMLLRTIRDELHPTSMLKKKPPKKSDAKTKPHLVSATIAKPRITSDEQAFEHCKKHYGGLYSTYGIFPNGRKGVIFDNDGQAIQRLFAGTAWEGGLHAKMMRGLRRAETLSWNELQLPCKGECTLIPWNSLIIDLDESRD